MSLLTLTGDQALAHIGSDAFAALWKALHARCPWATGCQHPDFVLPWYDIYRERHAPFVLVDAAADGSLRGLLTLALNQDGTRLTGAGAAQAEYQGWIAGTVHADRFAQDAFACIRAALPQAQTSLKYLPPGIPLGFLHASTGDRKYCVLHAHARPVLRIDPVAMEKLRRKKTHRQNANRLSRLGPLAFERVTGEAQFRRMFDDICLQYDFRQAALHRQTPFLSDPLKKRFYLELQRRGMLHTTVLTVGDALAAAHIGLLSKDRTVHLGISTHAPALAAHSPGQLLLALLGSQLAADRIDMLDLTPGGDPYKEHFASDHDEVFELTMAGSVAQRVRAQAAAGVRRTGKALLQMSGRRKVDVVEAMERLRALARRVDADGPRDVPRTGRALWRLAPGTLRRSAGALPVSRNSLEDVFKYDESAATVTRGMFIGTAMKRLEQGCELFCYAPCDKLVLHCWASARCGKGACPAPAQSVENGATVLFDLQAHSEEASDELMQRFVERILAALDQTAADAAVYYSGRLSTTCRQSIRRCGFVDATQPGSVQ
jgi:CelD/BcsL family acetyltransferase involved in cellulose biosynthesis